MSKTIELYASTISDQPNQVFSNLGIFEQEGLHGIHFDVMDGSFVPRFGLYPELLSAIRLETDLPIEVHMMSYESEKYFEAFVQAGASRLIVHAEATPHAHRMISMIRKMGVEAGIAFNPGTSFENLEYIADELDTVMLMAINPGIPKHAFIDSTKRKIEQLRKRIDSLNPNIRIDLDGGVTFDNARTLVDLGVDRLICGSGTIFHHSGRLTDNIKRLKEQFV